MKTARNVRVISWSAFAAVPAIAAFPLGSILAAGVLGGCDARGSLMAERPGDKAILAARPGDADRSNRGLTPETDRVGDALRHAPSDDPRVTKEESEDFLASMGVGLGAEVGGDRFDRTATGVDFDGSEPRITGFDDPATRDQNPGRAVASDMLAIYGEVENGRAPRVGSDGSGSVFRITSTTAGACFQPAIDPTGEMIVFSSTQHRARPDLYVKDVRSRTHTRLTKDAADDMMPAISPDGLEVAFASNRFGSWDIFTIPTEGGLATRITSDPDEVIHPSYSADGATLAYCKRSRQSGRWEIWTVDRATDSHRFLTYGLFPRWNPDPMRPTLLFQRAREVGTRLFSVWTVDLIESEPRNETEIVWAGNAACMHPTWSPDGMHIAFVTVVEPDEQPGTRPQQSDVWVVHRDGTGRSALTSGSDTNLSPVWGVDDTIYFVSDRSGQDNIWGVDVPRTISRGGAPRDRRAGVSP